MTAKIPPKPSPKPGKDVIYVDVDDEITGIIDKLENSSQKVVALVLPKRAASLQSIVNMKLLARSAEAAGKSPVLITSEAALLPLAGAAGLHVAKNLQSKPDVPDAPVGRTHVPAKKADEPEDEAEDEAEDDDESELPEKIDYSSPVGALAAAHEDESDAAIDLDDEAVDDTPAPKSSKKHKDKDKKLKVPNFDRFRMLLGLGVLAIIGLVAFIIFAVTVLPKAKITIQTSSESVSADFNVTASADTTVVDPAKSAMPAKLETMDQTGTQQVTATGQQNNGSKATGSVTFVNCNHDGTSSSVPAGTGISSNGLSYITQSTASMPNSAYFTTCKSGIPNSSATVNIVAVKPGANYNTGSTSFSVSCSSCSEVTASGSANSGTDNIVKILSQADVDGAKDKLTATTAATAFTKTFEDKLAAQDEYVLTSTLKAGDPNINATPAVGQPASTANVSIKITYTVLALKKVDLSQLIEAKMGDQIDKKKQKLSGNFLKDSNISVQSQGAPNSAQLSINTDTTAVPIISVDAVKQQVKGKKSGDIKAAIGNWPGVKNVDVSLGPFWVSKVPTKPNKITVILQEVKDSSKASSSDNKP